jgi:hypothetical protein
MADLRQTVSRAEEVEAAALGQLMMAAPADVAARLGLALVTDHGAVAGLIGTVDALSLNRVVGLGVAVPATEAQVDRILEFSRQIGVRRLFIQLAPTASPEALTSWLEARGARPYNRWVRLSRSGTTPLPSQPPTEFRVARIESEHARAFAQVVREGFGMPPTVDGWIASTVGRAGWYHYGVWDGNDLVATGALFSANNTAWFGLAATSADHRSRGAQSALIVERCRQATKLGCDWIIAETAEDLPDRPAPSYRNLLRLGFTEEYRRQNYAMTLGDSAKETS